MLLTALLIYCIGGFTNIYFGFKVTEKMGVSGTKKQDTFFAFMMFICWPWFALMFLVDVFNFCMYKLVSNGQSKEED